MLTVKTPEEVFALLETSFPSVMPAETVPLDAACGRTLAEAVCSREFVPGFDRSTVDGYAVRAADTFGCSDAMPALLPLKGEICMGEAAPTLPAGAGAAIPTGGALPAGCDAVVMLEYTEDYGDGSIGISKSVAPGANLIYKGDDVRPGQAVLPAGRLLTPQDIGALAALGVTQVPVRRRPVVGILSTGDELVAVSAVPAPGQVRDVNSALLAALVREAGGAPRLYGIIRDDESLLGAALDRALGECDAVLLSGGSSVGEKDAACRVLQSRGELLFHGIAMKPGKPTLLGRSGGKAVFGLPGHPVAAFFIAQLFVRALLYQLMGRRARRYTVPARLTEAVSANHGRAQYGGVFLEQRGGVLWAQPIHGKSGLITTLSGSDGYFCVPRDCEGFPRDAEIPVTLYRAD